MSSPLELEWKREPTLEWWWADPVSSRDHWQWRFIGRCEPLCTLEWVFHLFIGRYIGLERTCSWCSWRVNLAYHKLTSYSWVDLQSIITLSKWFLYPRSMFTRSPLNIHKELWVIYHVGKHVVHVTLQGSSVVAIGCLSLWGRFYTYIQIN